MDRFEAIFNHCSSSWWGSRYEIEKWHREKGWGNAEGVSCGYNFVICNGWIKPNYYVPAMDGALQIGRIIDADQYQDIDEVGAHAYGFNKGIISICIISEPDWKKRVRAISELRDTGFEWSATDDSAIILPQITVKQWDTLIKLNHDLCRQKEIPVDGGNDIRKGVRGHYEVNSSKSCPGFDMGAFRTILKTAGL